MAYWDSIEKIKTYIQAVQKDELILSVNFFRDYSCPSGCGGCCSKFTLDYFEGKRWDLFKKTYPKQVHKFEKRKVNKSIVYSNFQRNNESKKCEYLNLKNARCKIHKSNPFSCEFELNKFLIREEKSYLMNKLFGRGWAMMRVDGKRGALCEMKPFNFEKYQTDIKLLVELRNIAVSFGEKVPLLELVIIFLKQRKTPITKNITFTLKENNNQEFLI